MKPKHNLEVTNVDDIKGLIAKDELNEAMQLTLNLVKEINGDFFNTAILLSMELSSFKKIKQTSAMRWEEERRTKRNIATEMLNLLDNIN